MRANYRLAAGQTAPKAGMITVAALGLLAATGCREPESQAAPPPPTVGVVEARRMTVPILSSPTGTTRSLREVAVRARVRGFLTEQPFEEGSFVEEGQLLFVIEEEPFQVALKSAEARRDEAEAALKKAEASRAREIAEAQLAVDHAQLELARVEERRQQTLISRNVATQQELDEAIARRESYAAQVEADRAQLEQAKADYDVNILAARARLNEAEAAVQAAKLDLGYCRMFAPMSGRIGEARVKVGNLVGPTAPGGADNTELATVQQLDPMGVDIRVSSRYLERFSRLIAEGLAVRLTRTGLEGERPYPHEGRVNFYDNRIDPSTSTFLVKAEVPNPDGTLLPGEYVKLEMTIDVLEDAIVVPEQAVAETQAGPVVYLIDDDGTVAIQSVEAAQTHDGMRVVSAGLEPGRQVIVEGLQLVRPGIPVNAQPANLPEPVRPAAEDRTPIRLPDAEVPPVDETTADADARGSDQSAQGHLTTPDDQPNDSRLESEPAP
ncbi:efflux RND transporter periplasmic adaptor subunit [Tautonia marina]|uniref:efflux RND transporter periplasmic adaptor subunit n=1 Tax=Tautonia marina TaxID=2653855 RepID=UPI0012604EAC|nr:efflux RND transporter periplasmic adaptor subunit [Tautonia marina]